MSGALIISAILTVFGTILLAGIALIVVGGMFALLWGFVWEMVKDSRKNRSRNQ